MKNCIIHQNAVWYQSWQTLVTRGVPSLGAIAFNFLLAPPDWLQIITNGGGTCTHNNGC